MLRLRANSVINSCVAGRRFYTVVGCDKFPLASPKVAQEVRTSFDIQI